MALALYRKYRPKKLSEVLGQETNTEILKNAAKAGRFGHAYLFYGPRGTGKTTTARLIAKLLNCEKRKNNEKFQKLGEPCGECESCKETDMGMSFDVVEIDAASNRGIDEIRNLKEGISAAPAKGEFRVYIIDEVHMLTGAAFNALLKTLEEPPSHVIFVLATTEYEKVPATITSRTQRFIFRKVPKTRILEKLNLITQKEKIKITPEALELIAASGEGSLRDAESLLDQLGSAGDEITLEIAEKITGRTGLKKVSRLVELIIKKDLKKSLEYLGEINEEGHNISQFTKDLIHYIRKILSLRIDESLEKIMASELTTDEIKTLKELAKLAEVDDLIKTIKSLILAYTEIRYSPFALVPLEVALVENLSSNRNFLS